ncbi:hypothetical protein AVEN_234502-1 [Araneus ventricosus]|uniref:Uncharacterized protein n=1 Tax=Araneus ventricosus TaxID=182803 RepID=A0A4Y2A8Z7_ARAVE|nr:hypothetical protein AVEN_234502-1 [Araneus ventricosus]
MEISIFEDPVVRSRLWGCRAPSSKHDSTEDRRCMWTCCTLNHTQGTKCPPGGVVRKFKEGVPAQVSSFSSDRGSKLRGQSKNSHRVTSKRDVNVTKVNYIFDMGKAKQ